MTVLVTNNAWGLMRVAINATDTTILLETGQGDRFPAVSDDSNDCFYATLIDSNNELEIVKVDDRDVDTLRVIRGQDGTTAKSFGVGCRVEVRPVAALFNAKVDTEIFDTTIGKLIKQEQGDGDDDDNPELTDEEKQALCDLIGAVSKSADEEISGSKTWLADQYHDADIYLNQNAEDDDNPYDGHALVGYMADNDGWRIKGFASEKDGGSVEFATCDNGNEPIYIRQYKGDTTREFTDIANEACILDKSGDSQFPGEVTAVSFTASSDARLKRHFVKINEPNKIVRGITGYTFSRRDKEGIFGGVIAQDVAKVFPVAVKQDMYGYLKVDYNALIAVLIEANKKLENRVKKLEDFINKELK